MSIRRVAVGALLAIVAVWALALGAQHAATCAILGTVFDGSRTPLSGVNVEALSDVSGDQPHLMSTDGDGRFRFTDLPSGTYSVTMTSPDFQTFKSEGIYLNPGVNHAMTVTLKPTRIHN